jgi:hypothetical protein
VTALNEVLKTNLGDDLASHLPSRVLPVSTTVPDRVDLLIDREYSQIQELLKPGRRARDEARGRIRALLAMESHVVEEVKVSEKDIDRIEKAIRQKKPIADVFPRLGTIATTTSGEGIEIKVHFTKKQGAPVRFVSGDDPEQAAAVRELDLQKKFHMQASQLAQKVGLTGPKAAALRRHLGIDGDKDSTHVFEFGSQKIRCYSDNALRKMKDSLKVESIDDIWAAQRKKKARAAR